MASKCTLEDLKESELELLVPQWLQMYLEHLQRPLYKQQEMLLIV